MNMVGLQGLASVLVVLALVGVLAWMVRRGGLAGWRGGQRRMAIETAVPLGERRQLVIVNVEGRRLLLGLTPASVSMVAELAPQTLETDPEPAR